MHPHKKGGKNNSCKWKDVFLIKLEHLPVESEKDEVSLIVKGGDLSTHKLRVLREQSGEQTTNAVSEAGGEVVENHLWIVFGWLFTSSLKTGDRTAVHQYES